MHRVRLQSDRAETTQEGRDAVRPPQTHSRPRTAPITRPMWRSIRVHPRSHRPEPPETGKAQAIYTDRRMRSRDGNGRIHQMKAAARNHARNPTAFSTESAGSGLSLLMRTYIRRAAKPDIRMSTKRPYTLLWWAFARPVPP